MSGAMKHGAISPRLIAMELNEGDHFATNDGRTEERDTPPSIRMGLLEFQKGS